MGDIGKYVHKDKSLPTLLERMHSNDVKTFLLTNSDYEYSNVSHLPFLTHQFLFI